MTLQVHCNYVLCLPSLGHHNTPKQDIKSLIRQYKIMGQNSTKCKDIKATTRQNKWNKSFRIKVSLEEKTFSRTTFNNSPFNRFLHLLFLIHIPITPVLAHSRVSGSILSQDRVYLYWIECLIRGSPVIVLSFRILKPHNVGAASGGATSQTLLSASVYVRLLLCCSCFPSVSLPCQPAPH